MFLPIKSDKVIVERRMQTSDGETIFIRGFMDSHDEEVIINLLNLKTDMYEGIPSALYERDFAAMLELARKVTDEVRMLYNGG